MSCSSRFPPSVPMSAAFVLKTCSTGTSLAGTVAFTCLLSLISTSTLGPVPAHCSV